jgi:hypothetical protein
MENFNNIYYFLIGDLLTKNILYQLVIEKTESINQSKEIFKQMANLEAGNNNIANLRNKIPSESTKNSFLYFHITADFIFILLEADARLTESQAFRFIDNVLQENIHLMTNDLGGLNSNGKNMLKALALSYQGDCFGYSQRSDSNDYQFTVKEAFRGHLNNFNNNMNVLDIRNIRLKDSSAAFEKRVKRQKGIFKNTSSKMIIIIVGIVFILLVVILLPTILSQVLTSNDDSNKAK